MPTGSGLTAVTPASAKIDISDDQLVSPTSNACYWTGTGAERLIVNNSGGSPLTATITTTKTVLGLAVADQVVAVPAGDTVLLGPFPRDVYNDASDIVQAAFSTADALVLLIR